MSTRVQSLADEFRADYALAATHAVRELGDSGWESLWCRVARHAASDLLRPGADPLSILRRLERLVD